jgi:DNA-binding transcriptional LysR family regulator
MFSRFSLYFDEVCRRGSIRQAAEHLNIGPSAIDRQILLTEDRLGVKLFERMPQGVRLTAAGELLVDAIRRWRRDMTRVKSQIDDLQGLRRGEVRVATIEGAQEFLSRAIAGFHALYPGIVYRIQVAGAQAVAELIVNGDAEVGLAFNPVPNADVRVDKTLLYQIGAVVPPGHPLARLTEVSILDCNDYQLIIPDDSISLRTVLDQTWAKNGGVPPNYVAITSSISTIKSLAGAGLGVAMLTALDAMAEIDSGKLVFVPLAGKHIPLSVLSVISASSRALSVPAALMAQHLSSTMLAQNAPNI